MPFPHFTPQLHFGSGRRRRLDRIGRHELQAGEIEMFCIKPLHMLMIHYISGFSRNTQETSISFFKGREQIFFRQNI